MIRIKRVYDPPNEKDGLRVLVDRLWPRGLTRENAEVHLWLKEIAPSDELRKWFGHDPQKWEGFCRRYEQELKMNEDAIRILQEKIKGRRVTLLFSAKDEGHNNAIVLKRFLEKERVVS